MNRPSRLLSLTCTSCSCIAFLSAILVAGAAQATEQASAPALPSSTGSVFTMLLGLVAVLALMAGIAWLFKRSGLVQGANSNAVAKIIGGVSVGTRERVMVIEVADQWIVIGVAPGRVNTLATMPRQEHVAASASTASANFSSWLKQTIDKRNGSS
ncbi:flagellar biosynthetic protein FliO [Herbaspirillum sp. RV1423]|uniref:flagellar biosynthetic protein FliO n=1 Tax=Herbaspirillum sp. RV1423 TaxID=1443993 RepID=UPI0006840F37|nr:flagellar biosynthetic protein FliO [Herbaspirillum sp. RV1423]